jgi:hypothetical protein
MKLIVFLTGLLATYTAQACICFPMTFEDEVRVSSSIFHGLVISSTGYAYDIVIIQIWKGNFKSKTFHLTQETTSCTRRTFELNVEYLFYLQDSSVFNCSRTMEFNLTTDTQLLDLKFNGIGNKTTIDSESLTDIELNVLKNILSKANVEYPLNIMQIKILYAFESTLINKLAFFENLRWLSDKTKFVKVKDTQSANDSQTYILWSVTTGTNRSRN